MKNEQESTTPVTPTSEPSGNLQFSSSVQPPTLVPGNDTLLPSEIDGHDDKKHAELEHTTDGWTNLNETFIVYMDRTQATKKLNWRMTRIMPFYALLLIVMAITTDSWHLLAMLAIFIGSAYILVRRRLNQNVNPLITADPTGITINLLFTQCQVTWDNVGEIRPYTLIYRFAGINVKSPWRAKAPLFSKLYMFVAEWSRLLYLLLGQECFVISVPQQYSHFTAEEICEQLEQRKHYFNSQGGRRHLGASATIDR